MGVRRMTGTPWHVERYTRDGDERRHRSRCVYYNKSSKRCSKICDHCWGSAHCPLYRVDASKMSITSTSSKSSSSNVAVSTKSKKKTVPTNLKIATVRYKRIDEIRLNDRVYHKDLGLGWVRGKNERNASIHFDTGEQRLFSIEHCIAYGIVRKTKSI